ncbi:hypothetical protein NST99_13840 [Paenibacillus sp. FSL L8-0470]|uniref:Ger(x)C family spore germination protein n=1 Tax=Paenibacillus sp. FSL L8-0470 TaxID=2954688 RepID=UPI0030F6B666
MIVSEEISGENNRSTSPVALYTGSGRTMFEALANASRQTARFLSLAHVRVLVISEEFAREGIKDMLDVLERESDTRLTSLFFISRGQPAIDLLLTMTVFSKIPANDLVEKLETTSKQFGYNDRDVADSNDNLKTIAPKAILRVSGIAAFKDDKLKGWLEGYTVLGTVLLHNKIKFFTAALIEISELFGIPYRKMIYPCALIILFTSILDARCFIEHLDEGGRLLYMVYPLFIVVIPAILIIITALKSYFSAPRPG